MVCEYQLMKGVMNCWLVDHGPIIIKVQGYSLPFVWKLQEFYFP